MSKSTIHLTDPEEEHVVEVDSRDARAFERDGYRDLGLKVPLREVTLTAPQSMLHWLAFHALTARGGVPMSWAEFDARCTAVDGSVEAPDPTPPGPTPG